MKGTKRTLVDNFLGTAMSLYSTIRNEYLLARLFRIEFRKYKTNQLKKLRNVNKVNFYHYPLRANRKKEEGDEKEEKKSI